MKAKREYTIAWACWILAGVGLLMFRPESIWWIRGHLGAFLILEIVAVMIRRKPGDTLSEFMQGVTMKASSRARALQGWKAFVTLVAVLVSLEAGYAVAFAWNWMPLGVVVSLCLGCWLIAHWVEPEKFDL